MTGGSTLLAAAAQGGDELVGWLRGHPAPEILPTPANG
jgi:hypothetical protein